MDANPLFIKPCENLNLFKCIKVIMLAIKIFTWFYKKRIRKSKIESADG